MGRRTLLLIASILVAALGTTLVWLYVQGADTRAQQDSALVPVLFLAQDAQPGADAATLRVTQKEVPAASFPNAVISTTELAGQLLTVQALSGQVFLRTMLGKTSLQRFPNGGAVAITISDPNRVPADLQPGDFVDVYSLGTRGAGSPTAVITKIKVRSVGPAKQAGTGGASTPTGNVSGSIIGFDATRDQAEKLYALVASGEQPALYDTGVPAGAGG